MGRPKKARLPETQVLVEDLKTVTSPNTVDAFVVVTLPNWLLAVLPQLYNLPPASTSV